ncbi:hypothetical protein P280DRAFT_38855 [Massarina eburnea CBS 473.64]|uniref:Uncharacterized protein n=1 Tax=Massarina eburnea CBS 473.64 TaxID=1395130 RepID=A0A6A6RZY2_9PLEO|nr:hypothetical protein P280DRAFT_38855 [Massarina eburnea CBS 473.64]
MNILYAIVPVLVSNTEFTPFIMVFLNALFDTPGITEAAIRSTFQEVLPRLRVQYNLENWSREAAEDDITKKIILVPGIEYCPYTVHLSPIEGQELAKFISHAIHFGHYEDVISIIRKFTNELDYFSSEDFVPTIIPFLQGLASTLSTDKNGLLANSDYQKLFTYALDSYLGRCIEKEPAPPSDWSRPKISCLNSERWSGYPRSCTTCDDINKFLEDSQRTSFELQTGKDNHRHITSGLLESEVDCAAKSIKPDRFWKIRLDKTTKQYEEAKRKWGAESKAAETHLKAFDQNALKELLGNNYDAIMALKKVRLPSAPVPSASTEALAQPLQSGSANVATHMETPSASTQENVGRNAAMSHGIDPTDDSENEVASKRQRLA